MSLVCAVFVYAYWPSIAMIVGKWTLNTGIVSHGYLVVAVSAYLLFRSIPSVASCAGKPYWVAYPVMLCLSLIWLLGSVAIVMSVQTVVLPMILLAAIAACFGLQAARKASFAILFLYFAIPVWDLAQFFFQSITVHAVGMLVRITDIPAILDGNFVYLPMGNFEIAEGCSGLNYVLSGLSIAVLYSHLFLNEFRQSIKVIALSLVMAMIGNWVRVYTVIVFGHISDMRSSLVSDHDLLGWFIFAVFMIPVFVFAYRWETIGPADAPVTPNTAPRVRGTPAVVVLTAIFAMVTGPLLTQVYAAQRVAGPIDGILDLPVVAGRWSGPAVGHQSWSPEFSGPSLERFANYGADESIHVYVNHYNEQSQAREVINADNRIEGDWQRMSDDLPVTVTTASGEIEFSTMLANNHAGSWVIWRRYQIGSRFETSNVRAKIAQALETLSGTPAAGVIAISSPCSPSCADATSRLEEFVTAVGHEIRVDVFEDAS